MTNDGGNAADDARVAGDELSRLSAERVIGGAAAVIAAQRHHPSCA
jgi:hypothetical protein